MRARVVVGVALVAAAVVLGLWGWYRGADPTHAIHSVAILPLENYSGVPAQEYFADGLSKELVSDLGQVSKLRIAPLASATNYKNSRKPISDLARELNVDAVVQGSALREGNQVLMSVRLIDAQSNRPLWAHTYVRDLTTALAWQGEVAQAIAKEIDLAVTPQDSSSRSASPASPPMIRATSARSTSPRTQPCPRQSLRRLCRSSLWTAQSSISTL